MQQSNKNKYIQNINKEYKNKVNSQKIHANNVQPD